MTGRGKSRSQPGNVTVSGRIRSQRRREILLRVARILSDTTRIIIRPFERFGRRVCSAASPKKQRCHRRPAKGKDVLFLFIQSLHLWKFALLFCAFWLLNPLLERSLHKLTEKTTIYIGITVFYVSLIPYTGFFMKDIQILYYFAKTIQIQICR